jgi:hypothetical protein
MRVDRIDAAAPTRRSEERAIVSSLDRRVREAFFSG